MINDDDLKREVQKSIDKMYTALHINHYKQLIAYNRFIIENIIDTITGALLTILMNKYYYNILGSMHKATINMSNGRIEIDNFGLLIGADDNRENIEEIIYVFSCKFYRKELSIFSCDVKLQYDTNLEASILYIESELLDDLDVTDYDNLKIKNSEEACSLMEKMVRHNDTLDTICFALEDLLKIDEIKNIIDRLVFIIDGEEGDKNEE